MTLAGVEPPLSIETRSLLFSIAHNALTNAYHHAAASRVSVHLEFGEVDMREGLDWVHRVTLSHQQVGVIAASMNIARQQGADTESAEGVSDAS